MAKNYINDNNRWKSKGANMVEKAYGPSGFFDKVGDAISGVANTVGNGASTVGNALTGGGNDNNLLYLSGIPHTKIPNESIIDKIVELVENKVKEKTN